MKKWIVTAFAAFSTLIGAQAQTWQVGNTTLTESDLVTGLTLPWEILWGPDDYIWCTTRPGLLLRIDPATGNYVTVLNKSTVVPNDGDGEPGMLGMALHPDFLNTPTVYVVYNYMQGNNVKERLSAFTWDGSALVNEVTLIDAIGGNYIHNGSRLLITPDQKILMTTGDTGDSGVSSQNITSLNGKTLRINLDGSIPSDNPDPASYVWSYGHRNGQGLCIGPNGIIYESEHGQSNSDELNIIEPNRNYGWPTVQGACNTTAEQTYCAANNVKEPLLEWSPCRAVNGLEYYNHPAVPEWNNCILMAVLGGLSSNYERMSVIHLSADGLTATSVDAEDTYFQSFNRRIRDLCVNPNTGELYVAFNGAQYPGSGPNAIKKFSNLEYLGIQNNGAKGQNIALFPNPIEDTARLEFTSSFLGSTCQVFSFSGQLMGEFKVD
ncbi:MAG: hypothetical protein RLZZ77_987, partial [Bacteroidota bacterium]